MSDVPVPSGAPSNSAPTSATPSASGGSTAPATSSSSGAPAQGATSVSSNSKYAEPDTSTAAPQGETKAERKAREIAYKVKGEQRKLNIDTLSDEDLATRLQFSDMGRQSMQEAAEVRKAFQAVVEAIKKDPFAALQDPVFGMNLDELAEERLVGKYRETQMTPEERERLELRREADKYKAQVQEFESAREKQARQTLEAQIQEETEAEVLEALKSVNLPNNEWTVAMMADLMLMKLDPELEFDLTPAQMAAEVKGRAKDMTGSIIKDLKGEQLVEFLGQDAVREVLKYSVAKVRPNAAAPKQQQPVLDDTEDKQKSGAQRRRDSRMAFRKFLKDG